MATSSQTSSGGVGFTGLLTLLFIGLKLGGVITWPWLWVLSPIWISFGLVLTLLVIAGLSMLAAAALKDRRQRKAIEQRNAEVFRQKRRDNYRDRVTRMKSAN